MAQLTHEPFDRCCREGRKRYFIGSARSRTCKHVFNGERSATWCECRDEERARKIANFFDDLERSDVGIFDVFSNVPSFLSALPCACPRTARCCRASGRLACMIRYGSERRPIDPRSSCACAETARTHRRASRARSTSAEAYDRAGVTRVYCARSARRAGLCDARQSSGASFPLSSRARGIPARRRTRRQIRRGAPRRCGALSSILRDADAARTHLVRALQLRRRYDDPLPVAERMPVLLLLKDDAYAVNARVKSCSTAASLRCTNTTSARNRGKLLQHSPLRSLRSPQPHPTTRPSSCAHAIDGRMLAINAPCRISTHARGTNSR